MTTPSLIVITAVALKSLGFVILYFFLGFGPGFICGIWLVNRLFGRHLPTHKDSHQQAVAKATEANAQWHPDHERWQ